MRQEKTVKPQNPKCDETGAGRDESGKSRDESAARAGRQPPFQPPEQRTTAARAFHADRERLGLRSLAGLDGVLGRDQRGGVTTPKTDPGTVSKTVSKRPLGAGIPHRSTCAVPEEFA